MRSFRLFSFAQTHAIALGNLNTIAVYIESTVPNLSSQNPNRGISTKTLILGGAA